LPDQLGRIARRRNMRNLTAALAASSMADHNRLAALNLEATAAIGPSSDEIGTMMPARGWRLAVESHSSDVQIRRVPQGECRFICHGEQGAPR
jgi:hypothetical protein